MQKAAIQKRADGIRRIYAEYSKKMVALQQKHREETVQLLHDLEQRKIEELRRSILEN